MRNVNGAVWRACSIFDIPGPSCGRGLLGTGLESSPAPFNWKDILEVVPISTGKVQWRGKGGHGHYLGSLFLNYISCSAVGHLKRLGFVLR